MNPYEYAKSKVGEKEIPGVKNNQFIVDCHSTTSLSADDDETAWCSSFVNKCVIEGGYKGTNSAAAKSWLSWGKAIDKPVEGCVCIIRQKQKGADKATGSTSGYHVAFWVKEENNRVFLLGGNQADQVKVSSFGLGSYEICGYRIPA